MRQAKPWFRKSANAWYVQIDGKQVRLAEGEENEKQAITEFYRRMAHKTDRLPPPTKLTVAHLCDLFLAAIEGDVEQLTFDGYRDFLQSFCRECGKLNCLAVKPFHVNSWVKKNTQWNGARRHAIAAVKRAYSWAKKQGVLETNPVESLETPASQARKQVLSKEQCEEIMKEIQDEEFRQFVFAMMETGARPSEVARVTAEDVRFDLGVWILAKHKTSKKVRKPRVIYLTQTMVELSKTLVAKYPEGPLFRGPRKKKPFGKSGIATRFRRLRKKLPHLKDAVSYAIRHGWATAALMNGVGIAHVAELLGHRDTTMVQRHYSHIADKVDHMRAMAEKAVNPS